MSAAYIEYTSSMYMIPLLITKRDAACGYHQGACDNDIAALRMKPYIKTQLECIDRETLARELREYGAWDSEELADHDANLDRFLWLACGDIQDGNY